MTYASRFIIALSAFFAPVLSPAGVASAQDQYVLDPAHTHVQFSVRRFGFNDVIGFFRDVEGVVTLNEDTPENSFVSVEIAVTSIESGDATRNEHLVSPFWFDAENHPKMTFSSTSVELSGESSAVVVGDLTVLGVTKPVALNVVMNKLGVDPATRKAAVGFSATGELSRSAFGMTTAGELIGDGVAIRIEALGHLKE